MKIKHPKQLKPGTILHWPDGDTATVQNQTWGSVILRWQHSGARVIVAHHDPMWEQFEIFNQP
jgi:hypothetical protein